MICFVKGVFVMGKKDKKYYAVKKGFNIGIYETWVECQENINGYPGAIYQSFFSKEDAETFLQTSTQTNQEEVRRIYTEEDAVAYIYGAFNEDTSEYAYGAVIFYNGGEERFAEKFSDEEMAKMKNVAGEIEGAKRVMLFALQNNIKSIELFYVEDGIANWCIGSWSAKKSGTQEYKKFYNSVKDKVSVKFVKVKSQAADTYSEVAHSLAKATLGIEKAEGIATRSNGATVQGIKQEELLQIIELLMEDFPDLKYNINEIPHGTQYELVISNPTKQKVYLNYFDQNRKTWITGRQEDLYNRFIVYVIQLIDSDEVSEFLNTVHSLNIDKDVVQSEFEKYFPHSYDKMPAELNNYLHQAVYNLQITGNVYTANFLTEPAIRPLEGILKLALLDNQFPIRQEDKDFDTFFVFKEKEYGYVIREQYLKEEHTDKLKKYLCKCYAFYCQNRHTLFHWDNPTKIPDTTRILKTTAEAHVIIRDAIALIDEYFEI